MVVSTFRVSLAGAPRPHPPFVVRTRAAQDSEALFALFSEPSFCAQALMRDPFARAADLEAWLNSIPALQRVELVACLGETIIGFAALYVQGEHFDHSAIVSMGVCERARRRGVGGLLLSALLRTAQSYFGLGKLQLTVLADNATAIRLYERHGFEIEGRLRRYVRRGGAYADAYVMAALFEPGPLAPRC